MRYHEMKKVYIEHASAAYVSMFERFGFQVVYTPEIADLVCFTGGSDVSPVLYGAKVHTTTHADPYRDEKEKRLYDFLIEQGTPMVGICRGGQFLNVMNGGEMYQNVSGHCQSHHITDCLTGEVVYVSSTHHQMMKPSHLAEFVAYGAISSDREWYEGSVICRDRNSDNVEVVFYEHSSCLCFQPHPEFNGAEYEGMHTYFRTLLTRYLGM